VIEGLKMEEEWKVVRSWAKNMTAIDVGEMVRCDATFVEKSAIVAMIANLGTRTI